MSRGERLEPDFCEGILLDEDVPELKFGVSTSSAGDVSTGTPLSEGKMSCSSGPDESGSVISGWSGALSRRFCRGLPSLSNGFWGMVNTYC